MKTKTLKAIALATIFSMALPLAGALAANYVGNTNSYKFHRVTCRAAKRISPGNRIEFSTRQEAINYGMTPCKICKP